MAASRPTIDDARDAPTSARRIEVLARAAASMVDAPAGCPRTLAALSAALDEHILPFGTDLYADLFRKQAGDGQWLALALLGRAQRKAEDARRLGSLALAAGDPAERALLADLAGMDAEHVRGALAVFDRAFPRALDPADRAALDGLSSPEGTAPVPPVDPGERGALPDHLVDLVIERLRAATICLLLAGELPAWAAADARPGIERAMREAAARELAAVGQLAVLLERTTAAVAPEELGRWFGERVWRFERLSVEEPIELLYALRFGHYP